MYELALPISQHSIDHGKPGSFCHCAIALEFQAYFGQHYQVSVNYEFVVVYDLIRYSPPLFFSCQSDANDFIEAFDRPATVVPQTVHFTACPNP